MTKLKKGSAIFFICCCLSFYGYYFIKNQQKITLDHFQTSEQNLIKTFDLESINQEGDIIVPLTKNNNNIFLKIPTNTKKQTLTVIKEQLSQLATPLLKETKKDTRTKIVLGTTSQAIQKNISSYRYIKTTYQWNKRSNQWSETTTTLKINTLFNTLSEKELTLGDIFTNQQNLLIISQQIQEQLLAKVPIDSPNVEKILALSPLLESQTLFQYKKNSITIPFSAEQTDFKDYTLNYTQYGAFLNPDFVPAHYIVDPPSEKRTNKGNVIALTFDDGPNQQTTPDILRILKKKDVIATFFLLGQQVTLFPDILKEMALDGHELANHSYTHSNLVTLPFEETRQQITQTQRAIYQASGILPKYVRPPYGNVDYETAIAIGLPLINWSIDSLDWQTKNIKKIKDEVNSAIAPGSIILMHDIQEATAQALESLISDLQKKDYQFVTVSELLQVTPKPLAIYYSFDRQKKLTKE